MVSRKCNPLTRPTSRRRELASDTRTCSPGGLVGTPREPPLGYALGCRITLGVVYSSVLDVLYDSNLS